MKVERKVITQEELKGLMKEAFAKIVEAALEAELDDFLGYEPYERSDNPNYRNGYYKRKVQVENGNIEIRMPRDRNSEFEPKIVPKNGTKISKDIQEKILLLYAKGLSTRDIVDIVKDIYGVELSPSLISRITDRILPEIRAWQSRPLKEVYVSIFIDCMFFKVRDMNKVKNKALYLIIGIDDEGMREALGFWIAQQETASFWIEVLNDIKSRGVEHILTIVSDDLPGIENASLATFPEATHQKCVVHKVRNSLKKVSSKDRREVAKDLKKIYRATTKDMAMLEFEAFKDKYQDKYPSVVKDWEKDLDSVLAFYQYPYEIRRMLSTTNLIESVNSKIRKAADGKRVFPDDDSLAKVVYSAILELESKWTKPIKDWYLIRQQLKILYLDVL